MPDGEYVCFEVNPCPGFIYYERHTGQPISAALADLLNGTTPAGRLEVRRAMRCLRPFNQEETTMAKSSDKTSNQPFVSQADRPGLRLKSDTPLSELRVRDLATLLGQVGGTGKDFWDGKTGRRTISTAPTSVGRKAKNSRTRTRKKTKKRTKRRRSARSARSPRSRR